MNAREFGALVLLGAIWGASFLFIRITAPVFGPLFLMAIRVILAGLILAGVAVLIHKSPTLRGQWREFLILGALNAGIPFTLIAFAQLELTVAMASILNSTTPLFTTLVAAIWIGEALTRNKILGVILGIIGVTVLVGGSPFELTPTFLISALASLGAALAYGLGTVYAKRAFQDVPILTMSIGQLLGAGILLLPISMTALPHTAPTVDVLLSLVLLIVVSTSFAYLLYFYLLEHVGPTKTSTVTFLVPVFGTIWGTIFLQEPLSAGLFAGLAIILLSVTLVTEIGFGKSKRKPITPYS